VNLQDLLGGDDVSVTIPHGATNGDHLAERLWRRLPAVGPYPKGVLAVPEPIAGTSFFPGGFGLWHPEGGHPLPAMPVGGVMVLGHDFHSEEGYKASLARGCERDTQPTWRNLLTLLERVEIPPARCFFTNVFMGLRAGSGTTGPFPGRHDTEFVDRCRRFLAEQLDVQRPALILTLGTVAPRMLAHLSSDLGDWRAPGSLKALDAAGPVRRHVRFAEAGGLVASVVALTHPCFRHASVQHRSYGEYQGDEAEVAMLRDAPDGAVRAAILGEASAR
jgi:hypothetical protein